MFFLEKPEIKQLLKVKEAINNNTDFSQLESLCKEVASSISDKGFAYTYAACLLASRDLIDDAIKMFNKNSEDTFCKIMSDYLKETASFKLADKVFESADPYNIYTQTDFFRKHQSGALKHIYKFAQQNPPPKSKGPVTILDIGVGNGVFITKIVNEIIPLYGIKSIRLIIVDQSNDMLRLSKEYCKENIKIPTEVFTICCKIQEITKDQIEIIQNKKPIWFTNTGLSIHHMPWEVKIPMLKQLRELSSNLVLTEVNWNHDLPASNSPELFYSVAKSYGVFSESILHLPISEERRKRCLNNFPIAEAINIIKQDRAHRIDYHTTIEEWKRIAEEAGFATGTAKATYNYNNKAFAFVMVFHKIF